MIVAATDVGTISPRRPLVQDGGLPGGDAGGCAEAREGSGEFGHLPSEVIGVHIPPWLH